VRALLLILLAAGCGRLDFDEPPRLEAVAHVPANVEILGIGVLTIGDATIDTDALTLNDAPLPVGQMVASRQEAGGPELALIDAYLVRITGELHVVGSRALVIAAQLIDVSGTLDVGALGSQPGPGASTDASGTGKIGVHTGSVNDSGGGGGGHATPGSAGGASSGNPGGDGGLALGDPELTILAGGGRGGDGIGAVCGNPPGGGGGGAVQLTAATRITIASTGRVLAGGGGGGGGIECMDNDAGSAGGGGAGGAIYLAAPSIVLEGQLLAHGGGGGGGGNGNSGNGPIGTGMAGADGRTVEPAAGGSPAAPTSGAGGSGGTGDSAPGATIDVVHNGGGGGGAAGRIVVFGDREGEGLVSPPDQR